MEELKALLQKSAADYNAALLELKGKYEAERISREAIEVAVKTAKEEQDKVVKDVEAHLEEIQKKAAAWNSFGQQQQET